MQKIKLNNLVDDENNKKVVHHIIPMLPLPDKKSNSEDKVSYFMVHSWMATHLKLSGTSLLLYSIIFNFCNTTGRACYCSRRQFSELTNMTDVTISKSIKELETKKLIIVDRIQNYTKNVNTYTVDVETLFNSLSPHKINIEDDSTFVTSNDVDMTGIQINKLQKLALAYLQWKKLQESNTNVENSNSNPPTPNIFGTDNHNKTKKEIDNTPINNNEVDINIVDSPVNNIDTNNISNNISNNINTTSVTTSCVTEATRDDVEVLMNKNTTKIDNNKTDNNMETVTESISSLDSISESELTNSKITNEDKNKTIKKNSFKLSKTGTTPEKKRRQNRNKEKAKMFVLIKQMFLNETIHQPEFQPTHLFLAVEQGAGLGIILDRKAGNVRHNGFMKVGFHARQFLGDDRFHAGVLQSHGVDHARRAFGDARRGVAEAGLPRCPLERERAEDVDVVKFGELAPVAESPGRGNDGIVHFQTAERDLQAFVYASHRISSFSSTGPSRQMRL